MVEQQKISIGGIRKGRNEGRKAVTANRITDGVVVYLAADGRWTTRLAEAALFEGARAIAALDHASGQEGMVVGPYLMDIDPGADEATPAGRTALRERIRLSGPTVQSDYSTGGLAHA